MSVLGSRAFRQSRSLTRLLRYVCSRVLVEDAEPTTEYTIAVDVLGKPVDFKETKDASVRVEVHRLRKRLVEFYEQEGATHRIHILIPAGQYVPQFLIHENGDAPEPANAESALVPAPRTSLTSVSPHFPHDAAVPAAERRWRRRVPRIGRGGLTAAAAACIAVAALAVTPRVFPGPADALDSFWRPVFSSPNSILLCVGNVEGGRRPRPLSSISNSLTVLDFHLLPSEMLLVPDAATLSRFAGLLQSKGKRYRVVSQSEATFADLRNSPAVLIGLANNDWTERLVGSLRFTLERRPPGRYVLRDRENPTREDWFLDYREPYLSVTRDYALVARVLDPKTEQMVVTAAGISVLGTLAAGEFLTNPKEFRKIEAVAPKGWQKKNFEIVLSTDVIRGESGAPSIVAANFW